MRRIIIHNLRETWRWSLLMGIGSSIFSLMFGLLFQMVFYEIARSIPSVVRQDAHISLPLCNIFPDLKGCEPWVGALTNLEILKLSLQVGQVGGLFVNLILIALISIWVTVRVRDESLFAGVLMGIAGSFSALLLALTFDIPFNIRSPLGIFAILMLLLYPLSGLVGGRIGMKRLTRQISHSAAHFLPGDGSMRLGWGGESLSERELEVLALVADGLKNREIAQRLYISKATVKTHLIHIFGKLGVENRTAAVTQALAYGLLREEERETDST